jgi:hypothetical protein
MFFRELHFRGQRWLVPGVREVDKFTEIQAKREAARRAGRLAWTVTDDAVRDRMLAFARELEAEADALAWGRRSMEPKTGTVQ